MNGALSFQENYSEMKPDCHGAVTIVRRRTKLDHEQIMRLRAEGLTLHALAKRFGVSETTVWKVVPHACKPKPMPPASKLLRQRAAGMTYKALAEQFGISPTSVYWILHPRGVDGISAFVEPPRKSVASAASGLSQHDRYCAQVDWYLRKGLTMAQALDAVLEAPDASATS